MRKQSEEFKNWFKNSKVVDEHRNPLPVYHGTVNEFSTFQTDPLEKNSVNALGQNAIGSCFSESKEIASEYPFRIKEGEERKVLKVYLSIQSPKKYRTIRSLGDDMLEFYKQNNLPYAIGGAKERLKNVARFKQYLIEQGYDGITYLEGHPYQITKNKERVWVAFHPEQISVVNR